MCRPRCRITKHVPRTMIILVSWKETRSRGGGGGWVVWGKCGKNPSLSKGGNQKPEGNNGKTYKWWLSVKETQSVCMSVQMSVCTCVLFFFMYVCVTRRLMDIAIISALAERRSDRRISSRKHHTTRAVLKSSGVKEEGVGEGKKAHSLASHNRC